MSSNGDSVLQVLEKFLEDLHSCVHTRRFEELLLTSQIMKSSDVGASPEAWTRLHLIRRLLGAVNLEWENEIYGKGEGYPDFGITNLDILVIGEDKSINKIEDAEKDIKEYLNNRAASRGAEYGIATDGIEWIVYRIEVGGDYLDYSKIVSIDFRDALIQIARNKNYISQKSISKLDVRNICDLFYTIFNPNDFNRLLLHEAPKNIREKKKKSIKEFYDLYVELLFGEGNREYDYNTTLLDDVRAPYGVSDLDKRKFIIKLVNRLLFIKFLENKEVLSENFLINVVDSYVTENIGGTLYKSQLEPLFFNIFNTPHSMRISKHRNEWYDNIPYLNGSLFEADLGEKEYDIEDRMIIIVIRDLIEGHKLTEKESDKGFDPSLLGNVFEMTINHISGSKSSQKKEGAYYTPNDVIKIIISQVVLPKVYDVLINTYVDQICKNSENSDKNTISNMLKNYDLDTLLHKIEDNEGYFGDPDSIQEAYNKIGEIKVLDAACGSGHLLTSVLDEIHRIRLSLLRGLKGRNLNDSDIYKSKKELALYSIFGVDINPIGIEIAKLRVWLKMVEEGWKEEYGELPNININIKDGNSLIGLPELGQGQSSLKKFDFDLSAIHDVRNKYKKGAINKYELSNYINILKPQLSKIFLDNLNFFFEDEIKDVSRYEKIFKSSIYSPPAVNKIRLIKINGNLSKKESTTFKKMGFKTYKKSALIEVLKSRQILSQLDKYIKQGFKLEINRKANIIDIQELIDSGDLSYGPFHWMVEFPEVASDFEDRSMKFDIIVGNPPYGDILNKIEKRFIAGYKTSHINDIAAQFIERQIQLLNVDGYFGNVITLRFVYQDTASIVRGILRKHLDNVKIACFARRPSKIFDSSDPRVAIITGFKNERLREPSIIQTSNYIRFNDDDRSKRLMNIRYEKTDGLWLGEKIGSGEDYALPKIGYPIVRSILIKLKNASNVVFRDVISRDKKSRTEFNIWRRRGPEYWINPFFENLYGEGNEPSDFTPMSFKSDLDARMAFLLMQSSLFYLCWMVYGDQRHLNWGFIDVFPFPDSNVIQEYSDQIIELSTKIWSGMKERFDISAGVRGEMRNMSELKTIIDLADDLIGKIFNFTNNEIAFIKKYDIEYRV